MKEDEVRHAEGVTMRCAAVLDRQLGILVEDAYGLSAEERALLRATRPVRDPIDVLEARVAGLDNQNPEGEAEDD